MGTSDRPTLIASVGYVFICLVLQESKAREPGAQKSKETLAATSHGSLLSCRTVLKDNRKSGTNV